MDANIRSKAEQWLNGGYDPETVAKVQQLLKDNPDEITDAFYRNLEFGTGGNHHAALALQVADGE